MTFLEAVRPAPAIPPPAWLRALGKRFYPDRQAQVASSSLTTVLHPRLPAGYCEWFETGEMFGLQVWAAWVDQLREEVEKRRIALSIAQFDALYRSAFGAYLCRDDVESLQEFFATDSSKGWLPPRQSRGDAADLNRRARRQELAPAALVIVEALVDLNTGPLNLRHPAPVAEQAEAIPSEVLWQQSLPPVIQRVFATPPGLRLDVFAREVAHGTSSGVLGLAGNRGTGKSSVLYRVEQQAQRWLIALPRRPLLIRFDLGSQFSPRDFLCNFMEEVCRAAETHCSRPPMLPFSNLAASVLRTMRNLIAGLGRWSQVNRGWACAVACLATFGLIALQEWRPATLQLKTGIGVKPLEWGSDVGAISTIGRSVGLLLTSRSPTLLLPLLAALAILFVGTAHALQREFTRYQRRRSGTPEAETPVRDFLAFGFAFGTTLIGLFSLGLVEPDAYHPAAAAGLWFGWLVTLAGAQFLLPGWWLTLTHCRGMLDALRSRETTIRPEVIGLPGLGRVLDAILPSSIHAPNLKNMEAPFLEQEVKFLLRECVQGFGRVVVLIDDVDVLPSEHFHQLLRALRPLSKVPGVVAVVSLPRFFFDVWRLDKLGDLHSTLRDIYLVADPARHPPPLFNYKAPRLARFTREIIGLLQHRLRLRVDLVYEDDDAFIENAHPQVLNDLASLWTQNNRAAAAFGRWVAEMRPTLRELIRETHGLLAGVSTRFSAKLQERGELEAMAAQSKAEYLDTEDSLTANKGKFVSCEIPNDPPDTNAGKSGKKPA